MAFERRGNGTYYYTKRRIGKRVVSEYVGSGELAEAVAYLEQEARAERELARQALRHEQEVWDELLASMEAGRHVVGTEMCALLEAAGFHRHKRGEWRKKREAKQEAQG